MKKILTSAVLFIFVASGFINAQAPDWEWARSAGGPNQNVQVSGISTDVNGNSYITGYFYNDTLILGNYTLINSGSTGVYLGSIGIFIAKYDSAGNTLWAKSTEVNSNYYGLAICTDPNGNCLVTGGFTSALFILGQDTLTNSDTTFPKTFIVKLNSEGNAIWAQSAPGNPSAIAADVKGNIYLTGSLRDTAIFGIDTLRGKDIFIAKYDSSGHIIWARGGAAVSSVGISTDTKGNCFLTGDFGSFIIFGNDTLGGGECEQGVYVVKYDSSGNVDWATITWMVDCSQDYGSSSFVSGIACDAIGNSYIIGGEQTSPLNNPPPFGSMLMEKFDSTGNGFPWGVGMNGCPESYGGSISIDANQNSYIIPFIH